MIILAEQYDNKNNISFEKLASESKKLSFDDLTTNVQSPQVVGKDIKLIANATGEGPITYKFAVLKDNKAVLSRSYKEKNTYLWHPEEKGNYTIVCKAKDQYSETSKSVNYVIK